MDRKMTEGYSRIKRKGRKSMHRFTQRDKGKRKGKKKKKIKNKNERMRDREIKQQDRKKNRTN